MSDGVDLLVEDGVSDRLGQAADALRATLHDVASALAAALLSEARREASGPIVERRSGGYLASLSARVSLGADGVVGEVASDSPHAVMLEYGTRIPAFDMMPSAAQAMRFEGGAGAIFARHVRFPGAEVAPHPVMHAALDALSGRIVADMQRAGRAFVDRASS